MTVEKDVAMEKLIAALLDGDQALSLTETRRLIADGAGHRQIITDGVEAAMGRLDAKCTAEQFNLLEIMLCGRAVMGVMKELYPADAPSNASSEPPPPSRGSVVLCSLEGDIHDLGKNIFKMVLNASGYRVVDCGKDCPMNHLLDRARREQALAVGISGLITSIIPLVRQVRESLVKLGLEHIRVLAGGAALKQATAEDLQVDYVAITAFDGLKYLNRMTGGDL